MLQKLKSFIISIFDVVFIFNSTLFQALFLPFLLFPQMTFSNLARNQSFKRFCILQFFVQKIILCLNLYFWLNIWLSNSFFCLFKFLPSNFLQSLHPLCSLDRLILILFNPFLTYSLHSILILFFSTLYLEPTQFFHFFFNLVHSNIE